jgi:hypothetical protein
MRYRKVDPRIWNDEKFMSLTDDGKLAFFFLLTHPHMTSLGAMRATIAGLAAEIGWTQQRMDDAIGHGKSLGMIDGNKNCSYIGLPNFLKYNEPEGPNSVTKAWIEALNMVPECDEKRILIARCKIYLDKKSDEFKHAIGHAIWDVFDMPSNMPCPIQEQEQEQEKNKKKESKKKKSDSLISENFTITEAEQKNFQEKYPLLAIDQEREKFIDYHQAHGTKYTDWQAAFRTWLRKAEGFRRDREPVSIAPILEKLKDKIF